MSQYKRIITIALCSIFSTIVMSYADINGEQATTTGNNPHGWDLETLTNIVHLASNVPEQMILGTDPMLAFMVGYDFTSSGIDLPNAGQYIINITGDDGTNVELYAVAALDASGPGYTMANFYFGSNSLSNPEVVLANNGTTFRTTLVYSNSVYALDNELNYFPVNPDPGTFFPYTGGLGEKIGTTDITTPQPWFPPNMPFIPGAGGPIPTVTTLEAVTNQIPGLIVERITRENDFIGDGTSPLLEMDFFPPSTYGASGYMLLRSSDGVTNWAPQPWNSGDLETSSEFSDNFSFEPDGDYYYRLLVLGGDRSNDVSNAEYAEISYTNTRFTGWGLDESMWISGTMMPWVGRGLEASFTAIKLADSSPINNGLSYQWYRVNPFSYEKTPIPGETNQVYITTTNDLGGYRFLCKATGDEINVGGYSQVISGEGVLLPNLSFAYDISNSGFRLNLSNSVPSLTTNDLSLGYYDNISYEWVDIPITDLTNIQSNAVFEITASIPQGVQNISLSNDSDVWRIASGEGMGHIMEGLEIYIPNPFFQIDPSGNDINIWGMDWPVGTNVSIIVGNVSSPDFQTNVVVDEQMGWSFSSVAYDVIPNDLITVSDGQTTISNYVVTSVSVTNVDLDADMIFGYADPFSDVLVQIYRNGGQDMWQSVGRNVTANTNGYWVADFSTNAVEDPFGFGQALDLDLGLYGDASQADDRSIPHGATAIRIDIPMPWFAVDMPDALFGQNWPTGEVVSIRVGSEIAPAYTNSASVDAEGEWMLENLPYEFTAGQTVTVSTASISKEHVIAALQVTNVNIEADTISGTTEPYNTIQVSVWDEDRVEREVYADENGNWLVDFSMSQGENELRAYDIVAGDMGSAQKRDMDDDMTFVVWEHRLSLFHVNPRSDTIWGNGNHWPEDEQLSIAIGYDLGNPAYTNVINTDTNGNWWLDDIPLNIEIGMDISVSAPGGDTKEHTVQNLGWFPVVDANADTVSGTATTGSLVTVQIDGQANGYRNVITDGSGNWIADFSTGSNTFDIVEWTQGTAMIEDADSDATVIPWRSETVSNQLNLGWTQRIQDGGSSNFYEFGVELTGSNIVAARIATPSNTWYDLDVDDWWGHQWSFDAQRATQLGLEQDFPYGHYLVEITTSAGVTTNTFDASQVEWPLPTPTLQTPAHQEQSVAIPEAWASWVEPQDQTFDFVMIEVNDNLSYDIEENFPPSSANSFLMTNLTANTSYEMSLGFVNVQEIVTNNVMFGTFCGRFAEIDFMTSSEPAERTGYVPDWWSDFAVIATNAPATNDYAAANAGQLKHIATQARNAMSASIGLNTAAGTNINNTVNSFSNTTNYAAINIGQAKCVAKPFYDRLGETGRGYQYPWEAASTTNDYAIINIGQLKNLFNFDL